jgi:hypothetical protein
LAGRHPAIRSLEQLYDVTADPDERNELIAAHSLLQPMGGTATITESQNASSFSIATTLVTLRALLQSELANVTRSCGV